MVTLEELSKIAFASIEYSQNKSSMRVSAVDVSHFKMEEKKLAKKIGILKLQYESAHNLGAMPAYEELEEKCQISISAMKNTINGKIKPSRNFLYKLVVGLQLSLSEANELFALCGGELTEKCMADYVTIKALEDGDSIYEFIDQFQEFTKIKIEVRNREF